MEVPLLICFAFEPSGDESMSLIAVHVPAMYTSLFPSGDSVRPRPGIVAICRRFLPSGSIEYSRLASFAKTENRTRFPSAVHPGLPSSSGVFVNCVSPVPSAAITNTS